MSRSRLTIRGDIEDAQHPLMRPFPWIGRSTCAGGRNRARIRRRWPTDPQIAHIAYTAGDIDIEAAKQALEKSKNKEVRDFANDMVRDHTAVNDQALALVKKLNVTPEDNDTSKALAKAGRRKASRARQARRARPSTRPMSRTRSPTTRRSTARSRPR